MFKSRLGKGIRSDMGGRVKVVVECIIMIRLMIYINRALRRKQVKANQVERKRMIFVKLTKSEAIYTK